MEKFNFNLEVLLNSALTFIKENNYLEALKRYDYILSNNILLSDSSSKAKAYNHIVDNMDFEKVDLDYYKNILYLAILYNPDSFRLYIKAIDVYLHELNNGEIGCAIKFCQNQLKEAKKKIVTLEDEVNYKNNKKLLDNKIADFKKIIIDAPFTYSEVLRNTEYLEICVSDARIFYTYLTNDALEQMLSRNEYNKKHSSKLLLQELVAEKMFNALIGSKSNEVIMQIISIIEQRELPIKTLLTLLKNENSSKNINIESIYLYLEIKEAKTLTKRLIEKIDNVFKYCPLVINSAETVVRYLIINLLSKKFMDAPNYDEILETILFEAELFEKNVSTPLHILFSILDDFNDKEMKVTLAEVKEKLADLSLAYGKFTNINRYITILLNYLVDDESCFDNYFQLIYEVMDCNYDNTHKAESEDFENIWKSKSMQFNLINYLYNVDIIECKKMQDIFLNKIIPNEKNSAFIKELLMLKNIPDRIKIIIIKYFCDKNTALVWLNSQNRIAKFDFVSIEKNRLLFRDVYNYILAIKEYCSLSIKKVDEFHSSIVLFLSNTDLTKFDYSSYYTNNDKFKHGFSHSEMKPIADERIYKFPVFKIDEKFDLEIVEDENTIRCYKNYVDYLIDFIYVHIDEEFYVDYSNVDFSFPIADIFAMRRQFTD